MPSVYTVPAGDVLPILFDTFHPTTGAPITLGGFTTADIFIYKDGGVTQRTSAAGITLLDTDGVDFDARTGIHGFSINLADNTDAGFYTVGAWFTVIIDGVTINAVAFRWIVAAFRIMAAEVAAGEPVVDIGPMVDLAAVPTATASGRAALNWLFALGRNKTLQSTTTLTVKKDDGSTNLATAAVSDAAGVFTRDEFS